ncbi:Metalloprotease [Xylariaceae sp. FL0016]|nr:Metalloprotease [Xylariaceae sp. FL0016]
MFAKLFTVAALSAGALATIRTCGTEEPSDAHRAMSKQMAANEKAGNLTIQAIPTVDVYFHVVAAGSTEAKGYIPEAKMNAQFEYLEEAYAPYGITFNLVDIDYTINTDWASDGAEIEMKQALRQGDYSTLNFYFVNDLGNLLGYCYFPDDVTEGTRAFYKDGCTILSSSVPGGATANYNLGGTAVHESGHWFGLYHTFQGGCTGDGDEIDDTPAQASSTSGCPSSRDSCPNQAGDDPIHNYMDYSYDECYEEYTDDQVTRMNSMWSQYRS